MEKAYKLFIKLFKDDLIEEVKRKGRFIFILPIIDHDIYSDNYDIFGNHFTLIHSNYSKHKTSAKALVSVRQLLNIIGNKEILPFLLSKDKETKQLGKELLIKQLNDYEKTHFN